MKIFISILVLIFCLQSWTKADDIRDFQIEGMSIGDSALDFFSKSEITKNKRNWFKNKEYSHTEFRNLSKFKLYEDIHINYLSKDKKFILVAIEGVTFYRNEINKCLSKMKEIDLEFKNLFKNTIRGDIEKSKHNDSRIPGNNYITDIFYDFNNGDRVILACYDWSKESGYGDHLRISLREKKFKNFLRFKAYE
mgnify:FL=1